MIDASYQLILICAFLGLVSIGITGLSQRLGAPSLLLFLVVGMLAGEDGPGGIRFDDVSTAFLVGNIALAVILLDGGLRTHVSSFRVGLRPALVLSTLGVAITGALVGVVACWVLDWPLLNGLLLGAIVGSTDAAAVFGLLHAAGLQLKQRSGATLEIESGTNDPMAIFLTVSLLSLLSAGQDGIGVALFAEFFQQMGLGAALGLGGGWVLLQLLNRLTLPRVLYPLLAVTFGLSIFGLSNLWGGSGFLAIYLIGLLLGNRPLNYLHDIRWLMDGLAWLSQIGMFLLLGLLVTPSNLVDIIYPGLVIAAVLMLVARPAAVLLCLLPFRFPLREQVFISWVGLKGAVPIILALFPYLSGLEYSDTYFEVTFFVVLLSLCLQGWTIAPLARRLGLDVPPHAEDREHLGVALPGEDGRELLAYHIYPGSPADAYRLDRLPLPEAVRVVGVIREGEALPPAPDLNLRPGDYLVLLTPAHETRELPDLFSALPTPTHLLAHDFFGPFTLRSEALIDDVGAAYGVRIPEELRGLDLDSVMRKRVHHLPVVGDRLRLDSLELVVKKMAQGKVLQLGLKLHAH
ncbi:potassium/proton antiporter [Parahaliea mediterranea]|uniref:Potassium/proton antiporter n=1 Tax=Parahaliea mediterranea TaxID=651086 RepID=A0A939DIQ8_9GAMM|nr:potassium/proton antiporter [Parahaliea mediterranea]